MSQPVLLNKRWRAAAFTAVLCSIFAASPRAARASLDIVDELEPGLDSFEVLRAGARLSVGQSARWRALRMSERAAKLPGLTDSQRASALCAAGRTLVLLGDAIGAEKRFLRALELSPGDADVSYQLAQVMRDRPREALGHAERAARAGATARRRTAGHLLVAEILRDLDDDAGAVRSVESALKESGGDMDALEAMVRLKRGRPQEASVFAERAFRSAEAAPLWYRGAAFRLSARIWLEIKDYPRAAESLRRALDIHPVDLSALRAMRQLQNNLPPQRPPEGTRAADAPRTDADSRTEEALERAVEASPDDLESLRGLIEIRRGQGRIAEAAALAERFMDAIEDAPLWQQAEATCLLARIWVDLGDLQKARGSIDHAADFGYNSTEILALAQTIDDLIRKAHPELSRDRTSPLVPAYCNAAQVQLDLKDYSAAEKTLDLALRAAPQDLQALELYVMVKRARNRRDEALSYIDKLSAASAKAPREERAEAARRIDELRRSLDPAP